MKLFTTVGRSVMAPAVGDETREESSGSRLVSFLTFTGWSALALVVGYGLRREATTGNFWPAVLSSNPITGYIGSKIAENQMGWKPGERGGK